MADDNGELIVAGAVVVVGLVVLKPLMNKFLGDPAQLQSIQDAVDNAGPNSPFSANYQPFLDQYADIIDSYGSVQNWMFDLQNQFNSESATDNKMPDDYYYLRLASNAEAIHNGLGWLLNDNETVKGIFFSLDEKADVALIANYFYTVFGIDLLNYLQKGKLSFLGLDSGLPTTDLADIVKHINTLP